MDKMLIAAAATLAAIGAAEAQESNGDKTKDLPNALERLFDAPPQSRGANAWWHWQGANVTKLGITRDLEAMKDAGLSGATIFNIQDVGWDCEERMSTPLCPGMEYMNDKWWDLVSFAVSEAKRLGLELGIHNCPGYSTSGGPWITPELGMKKLVWAKGDKQPETKLGFYRDIARVKAKDGIYRFGYTCTGKNTHPSPPEVEAGSLEADKMNAKAVGVHIDNLLNGLAAHGLVASNPGLAFVLMDSYEAGDASWTDDFAQEFTKRRGYDPVPFLPVVAKLGTDFGPEREEQFRRDFERTKKELQTERHYRLFKERLNAAGLAFHLEPYSGPFDSLEATQFCDVPMTEFWVGTPFWAKEPSKGGACWFAGPVGRALGHNITGAESFTGYPIDDPFAITPRDLKIPLDATLARGVNRLSLHHWEHQPLGANARPGYSMGPWGTHFGENQTWHEPAKGFYRYIQRCQSLLQEGEMRCDALGLASFDEDGTDALPLSNFLTNTEVTASGKLRVKSSGREYSFLFLERGAEKRFADDTSWDAVEKKCFDLVRDYEKKGLKVGPAWKRTKYFEIAEGDREGVMASCRKSGDAAFFFVANTTDKPKKFTANFRQIEGRDFQPEIWNPETGEKRCIGDWLTKDGVTPVQLSLAAEESVFVVFRKDDGTRFYRRILPLAETFHDVKGPWTLRFDAGGGAPEDAQTLPALKSWTDFAEPGIRYYSGTATYETTLDVPETCDALDLGDVRDVAEVFLDGERIGALWHAPYRIELPRKLKPGRHALKVRVTNAWTNRLIGDEKEPDDCILSKKMLGFGVRMVQSEGVKRDIPHGRAVIAIPEEILANKPRKVARYAFSSWRYILSDKDLRPAGLLGQVKLVTRKLADVKVVQPPVKVIFDTDMLTDFDDVGALACLHALADAGECEILATISSTRGNASVGAVEIINRYYGRPELPVGSPKGMGVMGSRPGAKSKVDPASPLCDKTGGDGGHYKYRKLLADYPGWYRYADADDAPDANEVYRRVLAAQPDGSVTICTVGFLTNMRRLLETKPDDISSLDGKALVAKKVKRWVAMACQYPAGKEYNSMWDAESSRIALENWPTPIVFSDFQYGRDCFAGRAVAEMEGERNPVKDVFAGNIPSREEVKKDPAKWLHRLFGMGGRAAWDETAVLVAVRGTEPYFNVERGTYRMVGTDGADEWAPDAENGPHLRITEKLSKFEVGRVIDELMTRKPRK